MYEERNRYDVLKHKQGTKLLKLFENIIVLFSYCWQLIIVHTPASKEKWTWKQNPQQGLGDSFFLNKQISEISIATAIVYKLGWNWCEEIIIQKQIHQLFCNTRPPAFRQWRKLKSWKVPVHKKANHKSQNDSKRIAENWRWYEQSCYWNPATIRPTAYLIRKLCYSVSGEIKTVKSNNRYLWSASELKELSAMHTS